MKTISTTTIYDRVARLGLTAFGSLVLLFLSAPILVVIPLSFNSSSFLTFPMDGFSWRWYYGLLDSQVWHMAVRNTMIIAPSATILATIFGTLAALGLTRSRFPLKGIVTAILIAPMIVPLVIVAVGLSFYFSTLGLLNSYTGLIIAHAILGAPFVVIVVTASLTAFDNNLQRAAASLGASPIQVFLKITLPLIAPGVISGALFAFSVSFDEVVVTLFLAGATQTTIPLAMFSGIRENISPEIAAVATLMICMATLLLVSLELVRRRAVRLRLSTE